MRRPLLLAEIGLDSQRKGKQEQAEVLDWQIRTVGSAGCAGAFVFAWTDEWYRGGYEIEDWDFGLTDRDRNIKPALTSVNQAFQDFPLPTERSWPGFRWWSVVTTERLPFEIAWMPFSDSTIPITK